jgi:hypothetical protein
MFALDGHVALITGGNGGIGLGFAKGLAQMGADLIIWGQNPAKNTSAIQTLTDLGARAQAWQVDVSSEIEVKTAFAAGLAEFGRVDSCFANAGTYSKSAQFAKMKTEEWQRTQDVNLNGVFYTLREAAAHMQERFRAGDGGGRLIATSSTSAIMGAPRMQHYATTKGAILAMIKGLAVELAPFGITANSIVPGWIETAMTTKMFNNQRFASAVLPRIPAKRWGTEDDFAGIAVYLASKVSQYHTGDEIKIDGGYTLF